MSLRMERRNTHIPDCESRTHRKYSTDMASESTRFPNLCLKLMALPVAHRETRSIQEIDLEVQKGFEQVRERIGRITVIAIERNDDVAGCVANPRL